MEEVQTATAAPSKDRQGRAPLADQDKKSVPDDKHTRVGAPYDGDENTESFGGQADL